MKHLANTRLCTSCGCIPKKCCCSCSPKWGCQFRCGPGASFQPLNVERRRWISCLELRLQKIFDFDLSTACGVVLSGQARVSDFADSQEIPKRLSEQLQKARVEGC